MTVRASKGVRALPAVDSYGQTPSQMHTSYSCPFWYNVLAEQNLSAPFSGNIFHLYLRLPHNLFCKKMQKQANLLGHSERKDSRFFSQPEKSALPYFTYTPEVEHGSPEIFALGSLEIPNLDTSFSGVNRQGFLTSSKK